MATSVKKRDLDEDLWSFLFTWLWLAFQIPPRIRILAQDLVSVQPSEVPECLLDRWAAIYEDPRKSSSYSNGWKKEKNGHLFNGKNMDPWTLKWTLYFMWLSARIAKCSNLSIGQRKLRWNFFFLSLKRFEPKVHSPKMQRISWNGSRLCFISKFYLLDIVDFAFMILRSFPSIGQIESSTRVPRVCRRQPTARLSHMTAKKNKKR